MPTEINHVLFANVGEHVFYGGEQVMFIPIVMRLNPFLFQYPLKSFDYIEVCGARWETEYMESPLFPFLNIVLNLAALVDSGVIQNDHALFSNAKREVFHKFDESVVVYVFLGSETMVNTVAVNHSEEAESPSFVYRHAEILIFVFLCIRYIAFGTYMAFITIVQVNKAGFSLMLKLLQRFLFISLLLRRGYPFGYFSYTSKSCAIKDKNFLKAPYLTCFSVASSQAALTLEMLWRCCRITASLSFLVLMMRLGPFPGLFFKPAMPSVWNLLTQCRTRRYVCPALAPAAALLRPSALPNIIIYRIRNEWAAPFRYPFSNATLYSSVIFIFVACLDISGEISLCKTITFENGFHCINYLIKYTYGHKIN